MSTNRIQAVLEKEFARKRIVFWYDAELVTSPPVFRKNVSRKLSRSRISDPRNVCAGKR